MVTVKQLIHTILPHAQSTICDIIALMFHFYRTFGTTVIFRTVGKMYSPIVHSDTYAKR